MNILLIGNGFDLAHGLPTKYTDFLEFCKRANRIFTYAPGTSRETYIKNSLNGWKTKEEIKYELKNIYKDRIEEEKYRGILIENIEKYKRSKKLYELYIFYKLTYNNFWIQYFIDNNLYGKENWIDFESKISEVIQSVVIDLKNDGNRLYDSYKVESTSKEYLGKYYDKISKKINNSIKKFTYKELIDSLLLDLNCLIRAFEIYLSSFVDLGQIKKKSPDIESLRIDFVLSFNYTNTFMKLYKYMIDLNKDDKVDFIHGKADANNTIETNNMVLGIDEYLKKKKRNKQVEFIAFKKYYQRIHKETRCKYKEWLDMIRHDKKEVQNQLEIEYPKHIPFNDYEGQGKGHHLYIFGHSLDITDKDVLKEFILNDNVFTTIYYRNHDQKGQQIANLVKVIGQDELIRRTGGGSARTIEFKQQQDMRAV